MTPEEEKPLIFRLKLETSIGELELTADTAIESILDAIQEVFKALWANDCLGNIRGFRITWEEE
jgi:hypothetical protein